MYCFWSIFMVLSDFLNKAIPGGGPKKNFALRAKSCPLSFPISSLYRPYPFQYHPCIVIRPYPSPCILRSQCTINLESDSCTFFLYPSQVCPCIFHNLLPLSLPISYSPYPCLYFTFISLLCFSKFILKTTNISISVKGGFLYNYF